MTPIDVYHVDVMFDEALASAGNWQNYDLVETAGSISTDGAGDPLNLTAMILSADRKTVSLTTYDSMSGLPLMLSVHGVKDQAGNTMMAARTTFVGSTKADTDAPAIINSTPSAGASGVPVGTSVVIHFSEPIASNEYEVTVTWTTPSGPVDYYFYPYLSGSTITMLSFEVLDYNTVQTISLSGFKDRSGNLMPDTELSFTTTSVVDNTPPRLVSSRPFNNAVNVRENTTISLTFSEPMDRYDFRVDIVPQVIAETSTWSNNDRTITYTLREWDPLTTGRQYRIVVYPGGVYDLGGNTVRDFQTVIFTTGGELEQGQVSGRIFGDPGTPSSDPAGAIVFAESWDTYNMAKVPSGGAYAVRNLEWGPYAVRAFLDSNHDGVIDIFRGDALGGFGANVDENDFELETLWMPQGGNLRDIDFQIYDAAAASGTVAYSGQTVTEYHTVATGLFATAADATNLQNPVVRFEDGWAPSFRDDAEWLFNDLLQGFGEGIYYVAAYIDANDSGAFESGTDPAGVYGTPGSPTAIDFSNGRDYYELVIPVSDPVPAARVASAGPWPKTKLNPAFQGFADALAKSGVPQRVPPALVRNQFQPR